MCRIHIRLISNLNYVITQAIIKFLYGTTHSFSRKHYFRSSYLQYYFISDYFKLLKGYKLMVYVYKYCICLILVRLLFDMDLTVYMLCLCLRNVSACMCELNVSFGLYFMYEYNTPRIRLFILMPHDRLYKSKNLQMKKELRTRN